jgi:hypothetical protein
VFAATGAAALAKLNALKSQCGGPVCPQSSASDQSAIRTLANASTAGLVVAGVGAATGTVLVVVTRSKPVSKSGTPAEQGSVSWFGSAGLGGLAVGGRF